MLEIHQIPILSDNYVYLVIDKITRKSACIDPGVADPVNDLLEKLKINLDYILSTHHHNDHVGANLDLKKKHNCKIVGNFYDKERIPGIDIFLKDGDYFKLGESECKVLEVSGHTIGHIAYYFINENFLFCGDTLFSLGCGRLFEGTPEDMVKSLSKIRDLPDKTKIFCGHEYTLSNAMFVKKLEPKNKFLEIKIEEIKKKREENKPTIPSILGEEKKFNPFLKFDDNIFLEKIGIKNQSIVESLKILRQMKDEF